MLTFWLELTFIRDLWSFFLILEAVFTFSVFILISHQSYNFILHFQSIFSAIYFVCSGVWWLWKCWTTALSRDELWCTICCCCRCCCMGVLCSALYLYVLYLVPLCSLILPLASLLSVWLQCYCTSLCCNLCQSISLLTNKVKMLHGKGDMA